MIITIDGPAGTGKSTVAQRVAERLGYDFLDTGAMYRAIGYEALRRNVDLTNQRELAFVARHCRVEFDWTTAPPGVLLNGEPVGHAIRSHEATGAASHVAVVPAIREMLVQAQQRIGMEHGNIVTEGRDQGSVVFPDAPAKFYLDATPEERARRRVDQLRQRGEIVDYQQVFEQIAARDHRDSTRAIGPLAVPDDAIVIDTTGMSIDEVVERIVDHVQQHQVDRTPQP